MHTNTHRGRPLTGWHRASWVAFWSLLASTSCCCSPRCSHCWGQGAPSSSAGSDHEPPLQWTCPKQITSLWVFAINEVSANSSNDIFAVSECFNGLLMAGFYIWSHTEQQQKEKKKKVKANGLHLQITQNLAAKLSWLYVRKTKKRWKKTGTFLENPLKKHCYLPEEDVDAVDVAWVQTDWMSRLWGHILEQFQLKWSSTLTLWIKLFVKEFYKSMYPHPVFALHNLTSKHTVKLNQIMSSCKTADAKDDSCHHNQLFICSYLILLTTQSCNSCCWSCISTIPTPLPPDTFKLPHTLLHQTLLNFHTPSSTRCFQTSTHPPPPDTFKLPHNTHSSTRHFQASTQHTLLHQTLSSFHTTHTPPPDTFKLPHNTHFSTRHFQASTQHTLLHQTLSSFHTTHTPPPDTFKLPHNTHSSTRHFQASTQHTLLHQTLSSFHTTHTPPPDTFKLPHNTHSSTRHFQASTQHTLLHQTLSSFHTTHTPPPDTFKLPHNTHSSTRHFQASTDAPNPRLSNFHTHSFTWHF